VIALTILGAGLAVAFGLSCVLTVSILTVVVIGCTREWLADEHRRRDEARRDEHLVREAVRRAESAGWQA
jgi:hypothetical protein